MRENTHLVQLLSIDPFGEIILAWNALPITFIFQEIIQVVVGPRDQYDISVMSFEVKRHLFGDLNRSQPVVEIVQGILEEDTAVHIVLRDSRQILAVLTQHGILDGPQVFLEFFFDFPLVEVDKDSAEIWRSNFRIDNRKIIICLFIIY